eukprot:SAG22_NODE_3283_length_1805_cov_11.877101_2_plen_54_part_00
MGQDGIFGAILALLSASDAGVPDYDDVIGGLGHMGLATTAVLVAAVMLARCGR